MLGSATANEEVNEQQLSWLLLIFVWEWLATTFTFKWITDSSILWSSSISSLDFFCSQNYWSIYIKLEFLSISLSVCLSQRKIFAPFLALFLTLFSMLISLALKCLASLVPVFLAKCYTLSIQSCKNGVGVAPVDDAGGAYRKWKWWGHMLRIFIAPRFWCSNTVMSHWIAFSCVALSDWRFDWTTHNVLSFKLGPWNSSASTIFWTQLAQHSEAETVQRGGGHLQWKIWIHYCSHNYRFNWFWIHTTWAWICSVPNQIQSHCV